MSKITFGRSWVKLEGKRVEDLEFQRYKDWAMDPNRVDLYRDAILESYRRANLVQPEVVIPGYFDLFCKVKLNQPLN